MAKNLGRKFATMSEDERRRFALEEEEGTDDQPAPLDFEEPRNEDKEALRKAAPEAGDSAAGSE
jgi:hypothetical protein